MWGVQGCLTGEVIPGTELSLDTISNKAKEQSGVLQAFGVDLVSSLIGTALKLFLSLIFPSLCFEHKSQPQITYA